MTTTTHGMTADELWDLRPDGNRHELVRGELRTMAPSGSEHVGIIFDIGTYLNNFIKPRKLGRVIGAEGGCIIGRDPDTVRAPDVAFVRADRLPNGRLPKKFFPGAPDLAVEVMSPSDTAEELDEKIQQWLAAGTKIAWVVNPKSQTVTVYDSPSTARILHIDESLTGGDLLPGFTLPLREIFE
ncbi:MAG: Uma2 family endonuclease [Phycisphaerae bacterium]